MKKLLANNRIDEKKRAPIEVTASSNPVAPRSRIADHGCHDFGELHED
ncbi:hypothetical protein K2X83_02900 [Patescibacteria group bacterium]|nr:hypothetical protein [Patescibacteria group bacterium]